MLMFLLSSLYSCIDKFWPEIDKYEDVLVVDGLLTNGTDTTVVKLSMSSSVKNGKFVPVVGSNMYIIDESQTEIHLTETEPGIYKVLENNFTGHVGSSYQLLITLANGKKYESDICSMQAASPIDSVYGLIEKHQVPNTNDYIEGIQFYIDNHGNNNDTSYYLWNLQQSFEYKSSFNINYIWTGTYFDPYPKPDSLRTCWHTSPVPNIFSFTTKYLDGSVIKNLPLNFVSTYSKRLSIRYSLYIKQLSISVSAFTFWNAMQQQDVQASLYSQQPIQIKGNIHNTADPGEPVLGYFTVAGVSTKRIFIDRPPLVFYYDKCAPDYDGMRFIRFEPGPIYITEIDGTRAMGNTESCFDCRLEGGLITPPYFWEY